MTDKLEFHYKKSFGQHFLKNPEIAKHIVDSLKLTTSDDFIFEVGPGSGIMTQTKQLITKKTIISNLFLMLKNNFFNNIKKKCSIFKKNYLILHCQTFKN